MSGGGSDVKNKAGKATECDNVADDATLHGVVREGLEQRELKDMKKWAVQIPGKGLPNWISRSKDLRWERAWLASPEHVLWHLVDRVVTSGTCLCDALPFGFESVAHKAISPRSIFELTCVCCVRVSAALIKRDYPQIFRLENLKSGSVWVVMKYQSAGRSPSPGSATSLFCCLSLLSYRASFLPPCFMPRPQV